MAAMWLKRALLFLPFAALGPGWAACTVTSNVGTVPSDGAASDGGPDTGLDGTGQADVASDAPAEARVSNGCAPSVVQEGNWISLEVTSPSPSVPQGGTIASGTYVLTHLRADDIGMTGAVEIRETLEVTSSGSGGEFRRLSEKRNGSGDYGKLVTGELGSLWIRTNPYVQETPDCPAKGGTITVGFDVVGSTLTLHGENLIDRTYTRIR